MMKTSLLLLLFCMPVFSFDSRVENMVNRCESAMKQGLCFVAKDSANYPNSTIRVIGVGEIKTSSYLAIRALGDELNQDGTYKMCSFVKASCESRYEGDECKASRALWKQTPGTN